MRWKTEPTDEISLERLSAVGPGASRPLVDSIEGSRHSNLKELRATPTIRVFFAFDPRRVAVLLIGGDKAGKAKRFYRQMIAKADKIYDAHLRRIDEEASRNGT